MSEKQKEIMTDLAEKLPDMDKYTRGYLEGTIATAAAMSKAREGSRNSGNRVAS